MGLLLQLIDPLDENEAVWVGDEAMATVEFLGDQIEEEGRISLLSRLVDGAPPDSSITCRIASVLGPDALLTCGDSVEVLRRLLHAKPTQLGLRVMAQLAPFVPADLYDEMAAILLVRWMSISHPPWLGFQRALLLTTLAAPLPVLRNLENRAAALLRGGHPVTSASLNALFTTLEMVFPALMPLCSR
jgi:hypothetical protein